MRKMTQNAPQAGRFQPISTENEQKKRVSTTKSPQTSCESSISHQTRMVPPETSRGRPAYVVCQYHRGREADYCRCLHRKEPAGADAWATAPPAQSHRTPAPIHLVNHVNPVRSVSLKKRTQTCPGLRSRVSTCTEKSRHAHIQLELNCAKQTQCGDRKVQSDLCPRGSGVQNKANFRLQHQRVRPKIGPHLKE